MGHTNFLIKLRLTWVQDLGSSPKSSRTSNNTLNISYWTKITQKQKVVGINFFEITIIVAHNKFLPKKEKKKRNYQQKKLLIIYIFIYNIYTIFFFFKR